MSRGAAARWGKLGNYDNGWCVCARKLRVNPYFLRTKVFSIFLEPARKMFARSRWLFKGIDNGDIKELFFKFLSTLFFKKIIFD